jgi:hypothetical protein
MKKQIKLLQDAADNKLNLGKKTISNLTASEMKGLVGAGKTKGNNCFTNAVTCFCSHHCTGF